VYYDENLVSSTRFVYLSMSIFTVGANTTTDVVFALTLNMDIDKKTKVLELTGSKPDKM